MLEKLNHGHHDLMVMRPSHMYLYIYVCVGHHANSQTPTLQYKFAAEFCHVLVNPFCVEFLVWKINLTLLKVPFALFLKYFYIRCCSFENFFVYLQIEKLLTQIVSIWLCLPCGDCVRFVHGIILMLCPDDTLTKEWKTLIIKKRLLVHKQLLLI